MIQLLHGDCLELMRGMADCSVDAGITSPPYNLGGDFHSSSVNGPSWTYGGYNEFDDNMPEDEYQRQQVEVLDELYRVIKPTGFLFYSHKNRIKDGRLISPLAWIEKSQWVVLQSIVINLSNTPNVDKRRFFPVHELLFVLSATAGNKLNNTDCLTDVWTIPHMNRKQLGHPAAFHVNIPLRCINAATNPGDVVIDPYVGSGTTMLACQKTDRRGVGIERDPNYYAIAQRRIAEAQMQPALFTEAA